MSKPIAVLISDVHYSVPNLKLADAAMRMAIAKANDLDVPLIVAGDLHDTKANMRAECVNAMAETLNKCFQRPYIIVGNHCRISEKAPEHALNFLSPYGTIVDVPWFYNELSTIFGKSIHLIPYHHNADELREYLRRVDKGSTLIMHQGIEGSDSGEYMQDKSALRKEDVKDFQVISGHYHSRQTIICRKGPALADADYGGVIKYRRLNQHVGTWDYIGNPYTQNYAEANDPEKGFQILMDDGSLEFVPTNLRKHIVIDTEVDELVAIPYLHKPGDLLWFKVRDTKEKLAGVTKNLIADNYGIEEGFRLDLIPTDSSINVPEASRNLTQGALLDSLIDSQPDMPKDRLEALKQLWKSLL